MRLVELKCFVENVKSKSKAERQIPNLNREDGEQFDCILLRKVIVCIGEIVGTESTEYWLERQEFGMTFPAEFPNDKLL